MIIIIIITVFDQSLLPRDQPTTIPDERASISDVLKEDIPSLSLSDDLDDENYGSEGGSDTFQSLLNDLSKLSGKKL